MSRFERRKRSSQSSHDSANRDALAGDIISFGRDGKTLLRRTARIEGDRVWVLQGSLEEEIAREEITGKVLHTIKAEWRAKLPEEEDSKEQDD